MSTKPIRILALAAAMTIVAACTERPPEQAALTSGVDPSSSAHPAPARSGLNSDPNNPNGVPGPSTGLGTSNSRY
jgi:hypothetical protein